MSAMKPDPLDAAVVNHSMDDHNVEQRPHHSKDSETIETTKDNKHSPGSPRNTDVIFETWDMVSNKHLLSSIQFQSVKGNLQRFHWE